jgi:hypothetical protein
VWLPTPISRAWAWTSEVARSRPEAAWWARRRLVR